jgi:hypothetical protein
MELSTPEDGMLQLGACEVSIPKLCLPQVDALEVGIEEIGALEPRAAEVSIPEISACKVGALQVNKFEVGTLQFSLDEDCPTMDCAAKISM